MPESIITQYIKDARLKDGGNPDKMRSFAEMIRQIAPIVGIGNHTVFTSIPVRPSEKETISKITDSLSIGDVSYFIGSMVGKNHSGKMAEFLDIPKEFFRVLEEQSRESVITIFGIVEGVSAVVEFQNPSRFLTTIVFEMSYSRTRDEVKTAATLKEKETAIQSFSKRLEKMIDGEAYITLFDDAGEVLMIRILVQSVDNVEVDFCKAFDFQAVQARPMSNEMYDEILKFTHEATN